MTQRVPVVIVGDGRVTDAFRGLLASCRDDIAGVTGVLLDVAQHLGPEASVLVDTGGALSTVHSAVAGGHSAVTSGLSALVADPAKFAVLRSDGCLGFSAALLPGLPVLSTLRHLVETRDVLEEVELIGGPVGQLVDEALATAAVIGIQLRYEDVDVRGDATAHGRALIRPGQRPVVFGDSEPAGILRTVQIRSRRTGPAGLTLSGPVGAEERVSAALLGDVLALAQQQDTPWREHRRRRAAAS